jgi:lipoate synthase
MSWKYSRTNCSVRPVVISFGATMTSACPMCPIALSGTSTTDAVEAERIARNTVDIISQGSYR